MQFGSRMDYSKTRNTSQDPSLSSHIQTLHNQKTNLPRLKYSLTCISNTLSYTNSNRYNNILSISKPVNFKQIVNLLIHYQDQKILEQSLSILNVLLNEGNDLTVQQENQIMHSLSYVKLSNQAQKGFISDKLVQEILYLTYKLKTKNLLSEFIATLMSQKMTAIQAKKMIKQLERQELRNISISDLVKIGMKFKNNVLLMNQMLNLIYEKVFSRKQYENIKNLYDFIFQIVEQNIDQESISYKCLQIYKIIENIGNNKVDPLISRYLQSLLKHKKDLLLPLKREFISTEQDFIKIVEYGCQFQIYHLLVVDYLIRNGYGGIQKWRNALMQSQNKKNSKLKEICLRIDNLNQNQIKSSITQKDQSQFLKVLPIEILTFSASIFQKLLIEPTISNCLHAIKNLCFYKKSSPQLLLTIHKIALKQKQFHLVQQIQKLVKQSFNQQFLYERLKNITKVNHKIVLQGQLYFIWLPILFKDQKLLKDLENELIEIMNYDSIDIEDKFYVMGYLLQNKQQKAVTKFVLYLNRQLQGLTATDEQSCKEAQNLFKQIKNYLKQWITKIKNNSQVINFYFHKLLFNLERTAQLLFSKLVQFKSEAITTLLFELEKWDYYSQNWRQPYRWLLTALEQINQQSPIYTLDCLQLFEMTVQNLKSNDIPAFAKQRFMKSVKKNWSKFQSEHLFAIQRIIQILWENHQYPILSDLLPIKSVTDLIQLQKQFNKKNQYFFQSEHPTSNYLINLQMSHFFGLISQEEFVRYILQLYDKRFSQTKRFTQKNVISLMNFIIWIYQYSQEDMNSGLSEMILAFLGYKSLGGNQISSYNIRKKCIEIVAVVSHSINLLKLPMKDLLQIYIGQHTVMKHINEILQTIIESKPSFLSQLNLQKIVQSVMICLITCENVQLIEEYINFVQAICYIQNSKYATMFQSSMSTLYQIIKVQFKIVEKYRKQLVSFVLDVLKHYEYVIQNSLLWFLMNKYFVQESIQLTLLEVLINNRQTHKNWSKLQYSNQKLLVRLIMHHNENQELISMVQQILNSAEKQAPSLKEQQVAVSQSQNKSSALSAIIQAPQNLFIKNFKSQNYPQCQQLLPELRNPLLIVLTKEQIKPFVSYKDLVKCQNLLNFLVKNPTTRNQILSVQEFYIRVQCLPYIEKISSTLAWTQQTLQKIRFKSFNQKSLTFQLQLNKLETVLKQAVSGLFCTVNIKKNVIFFLKSIKTTKQQIQLLSFYSKLLPKQINPLLFQIVKEIKLQQGVQLMKLNLALRIQNYAQASVDLLLHHLSVHTQNILNRKSSPLKDQQIYFQKVASYICPHQIQKYLAIANHFFINLSSKIGNQILPQPIRKELIDVSYKYLMIFQNGNQNAGNIKILQLKQIDYFAILTAIMFMHKNQENINFPLINKIMTSLQTKCELNDILKQAYDYLQGVKANSLEKSPKINLKKGNQSPPKKVFAQNIVFAKQLPTQQEEQIQTPKQQNQVSQAFRKGKQLEEYMSVIPRQAKALAEKQQKQKQKDNLQINIVKESNPSSLQIIDPSSQNIMRPKQSLFDQKQFYEIQPNSQYVIRQISETERKQNLQIIRSKQSEQISIASLKQHAKFISSLIEYDRLTKEEIQELMKSIDNITSTVNQHHYYVKKLVEMEVTFKLIRLFKRKEVVIPQQLSYFGEIFQNKLLKLHHAMSYKKQKKTIVFDDELTIEFLKLIINKSIISKKPRQENLFIIEIVMYCIKSIDAFFKQGLISMFLQLIKMDINSQDLLKFFCKIQLSKHVIFQIYQRGILTKLVEVFGSTNPNIASNSVLNLWIRLAGKICTTAAIQQKYLQKNIHKFIWDKHSLLLSNDLESKKNMAYFFAMFGKKNPKVFDFLSQNQILQKLFLTLKLENSQQLYMMFYFVFLDNQNSIDYCFRIKYHTHLIQKLGISKQGDRPNKYKFFYKSLGQIMSNKHHQALFFKQNVVQKLVREYEVKAQPSIYQCLLDFVVTLDNDKQFQELKKQDFWSCLSLFQYKLSSQATYAYILQIFLVMIKKGRIKEFNTPEVRGKVTLKAEYSINLEGKQLALRFITALSLKTKQCYITQRCIRLLGSIIGFKVTSNELDIIEDMLDVEGMIQNFEFFSFCQEYEITQIICQRFKGFTESELLSALKILNILGTQYKNNKILRDKLLIPVMEMLTVPNKPLNPVVQEWLFKLILVIVSFRQNNQIVQKMEMGKFMINILNKITVRPPEKRKKILEEYVTVVEMCRQNSMIPVMELQKVLEQLDKAKVDKEVSRISQIKQNLKGSVTSQTNQILNKMSDGIQVKMYKNDGSSSQLFLFVTEDKLQLNCAVDKGQPVKQKWRLVLSQVNEINQWIDQKEYQKSAFSKSAGLFSSAPDRRLCLTIKTKNNEFNVFFARKDDKDEWKKYVEFAIQNSKKILKQFK